LRGAERRADRRDLRQCQRRLRFCGAGIAVVNALSAFCALEIRQDGRTWVVQRYREGKVLTPFAEIGPASADRCGSSSSRTRGSCPGE
jgi:hypothetical protein